MGVAQRSIRLSPTMKKIGGQIVSFKDFHSIFTEYEGGFSVRRSDRHVFFDRLLQHVAIPKRSGHVAV